MRHLKPYKIFESHGLDPETVDTIKDMFVDITDDWNIVSDIYYHDGTYAGKKQSEPAKSTKNRSKTERD